MSKNKGTLVSSTIRPSSIGSDLAVAHSNEMLGGYHSVITYVDRDDIPTSRREFGMLVYILSADEFYQLKTTNSADLSDNLNWNLVNFNGGVRYSTEWLDSVISRSGTPPITPSVGDRYLVVGGSGIWTTLNDLVVEWNGSSYDLTDPTEGTIVKVDDESDCLYIYLNDDYPSGTWTKQELGGWSYDSIGFQYMSDINRLLGIGLTGSNIDSKLHISTDGTIPGTSSYIDSAFKVEVKGASAVSNGVYSGYFTGGDGVYIDKLEIGKINLKDERFGFGYSTNSTSFDLWTYSLSTASMVKIEVEINAIEDTNGDSSLYSSSLGVIARNSIGDVYQVGSFDKTLKSLYFISADVGLTFSGAIISLQANGDAAKNINWIFNISYTELSAQFSKKLKL